MRRIFVGLLLGLLFAVQSAQASPGIVVEYTAGTLRVSLDGSYAGAYYRVWRSNELAATFSPIATTPTLCLGDCFLLDPEVMPGATYYYRFDIDTPGAGFISYGPYVVTVPELPVRARAWPNPSNGNVRIELSLPGSSRLDAPLAAEASVVDLQGRTVRRLYAGALARGVTSIGWDGRGDASHLLGAGIYFVRLATPLGTSMTRIVRVR